MRLLCPIFPVHMLFQWNLSLKLMCLLIFSGCGPASRWKLVPTSWCIYLKKRPRIRGPVAEAAAAGKPQARQPHRWSRDPIAGSGWEKIWQSWHTRARVIHLWWRIVDLVTAMPANLCPCRSLITRLQSYHPLLAVNCAFLTSFSVMPLFAARDFVHSHSHKNGFNPFPLSCLLKWFIVM